MTFGRDKISKPDNMKLEAQLSSIAAIQNKTEKKIAIAKAHYETYAGLNGIQQKDFSGVKTKLPAISGCMTRVEVAKRQGEQLVERLWQERDEAMQKTEAVCECIEKRNGTIYSRLEREAREKVYK